MSIFGSDGKLHRVTGVYPRGVLPTYRVRFTDGSFLDCDGDHLWTFEMRRKNGKPYETINTRKLLNEKLREGNGKGGHRKFYVPLVKPIEYAVESKLRIDPYTLGVILGDGGILVKNMVMLTLHDKDREILDHLSLPDDVRVVRNDSVDRCPSYNMAGSHLTLYPLIEKYGLGEASSKTKFIPEPYLRSSVQDRLSLLQGLMDTDGTVNGHYARFSTTSKRLCNGVKDLVQSLGGTCSVSKRITSCQTVKDRKSYRLGICLPVGMNCFRLKRKRDRLIQKWGPRRAVDSVERIKDREIVCISVDSNDSLYVTKDHIVTHNTVVSLGVWTRISRKAIVIVNKGFLLKQWVRRIKGRRNKAGELIQPGFAPNARVGIIRGKKCEYGDDYDISIAMIHSLSEHVDELPEEFWRSFGLVITDEVHRIGAPTWGNIVPRFYSAYRLGVTATPRRKDGAEKVFFWHIGEILHVSKVKRVTPRLRRIFTGLVFRSARSWDPNQASRESQIRKLAPNQERNALIIRELLIASKKGRKIIVLSERRRQLELLNEMFKKAAPTKMVKGKEIPVTSAFYVGGMKEEELDESELADVLWSTYQMTAEALDIPALDTAFLASPVSDPEQSVGRIMREYGDKEPPIISDFIDAGVPEFARMWNKRKEFYIREGMYVPKDGE
jgi:hypothetical protein